MIELVLRLALVNQDTRSLAQQLLAKYRTLASTVAAPISDLIAFQDLGRPGALLLKLLRAAVVNLLREDIRHSPILTSPNKLIDYLFASMANESVECFHILFLDNQGMLIADERQTAGTIDQVAIYPREVVRRCLALHASGLIMVHNHPSGNLEPSQKDIAMTVAVQRAAAVMGIRLHDHIIVGKSGYRSFRQEKIVG